MTMETSVKTESATAHSTRPVLVVDDSSDFRLLMTLVLRGKGFIVEEACDGVDAFQYLLSHPCPIAILLDLQMPRMNGLQFREAQVADSRFREIPVVLYSNVPDLEEIAELLRVDGFVSKHAPTDTIVGEVVRCLRVKSSGES